MSIVKGSFIVTPPIIWILIFLFIYTFSIRLFGSGRIYLIRLIKKLIMNKGWTEVFVKHALKINVTSREAVHTEVKKILTTWVILIRAGVEKIKSVWLYNGGLVIQFI